jgi:hypothetical protein
MPPLRTTFLALALLSPEAAYAAAPNNPQFALVAAENGPIEPSTTLSSPPADRVGQSSTSQSLHDDSPSIFVPALIAATVTMAVQIFTCLTLGFCIFTPGF